jgi:hypothetical protein
VDRLCGHPLCLKQSKLSAYRPPNKKPDKLGLFIWSG